MNGQKRAHEELGRLRRPSSAVASERSSAIVFGASSPNTMCSAVMSGEGDGDGDAVRGGVREARRQERDAGWMSDGERRLADPAEAEAGHRDAELRGGDVAVGIG